MSAVRLLVALCSVLCTRGTDAQMTSAPAGPEFGSSSVEKGPKVKSGPPGWWSLWCIVATVLVALVALLVAAIVSCSIRRRRAEKKAAKHRFKLCPARKDIQWQASYERRRVPPPRPPAVAADTAAMDRTQDSSREAAGNEAAGRQSQSPQERSGSGSGNVLVSTSEKERGDTAQPRPDNAANAASSASLVALVDANPSGTQTQHTADAASVRSSSVTVSEGSIDAILVDSY